MQVVEILKSSGSSELFNPDVDKDRRRHDPVTKDLLGALLAVTLFKCSENKDKHRRSKAIDKKGNKQPISRTTQKKGIIKQAR